MFDLGDGKRRWSFGFGGSLSGSFFKLKFDLRLERSDGFHEVLSVLNQISASWRAPPLFLSALWSIVFPATGTYCWPTLLGKCTEVFLLFWRVDQISCTINRLPVWRRRRRKRWSEDEFQLFCINKIKLYSSNFFTCFEHKFEAILEILRLFWVKLWFNSGRIAAEILTLFSAFLYVKLSFNSGNIANF